MGTDRLPFFTAPTLELQELGKLLKHLVVHPVWVSAEHSAATIGDDVNPALGPGD
jgi:hypothetical protein